MTQDGVDQEESEELSRIKQRIASLVQERFSAGASIYYLSQLGIDLGADRLLLERLSRRKLGQFIEDVFDFTIRVTGEHHNVRYIARDATAVLTPALPRYNRSFWAAFTIPLEGERRFINLNTQRFGPDETALRVDGGEVREIAADYVALKGATRDATRIAGQIQRWLTDQNLDPTPFLLSGERHVVRNPSPSALDILLAALDSEQLRRVSLPLDIVQALKVRAAR